MDPRFGGDDSVLVDENRETHTMLILWISPVLLFLALIASRATPALVAATLALALSGIVVVAAGPMAVVPAEYAAMLLAGAWIAMPAVLVILAGLYFTEVLAQTRAKAMVPSPRALGTICLFVAPFIETATGFGVGYVVAVTATMRAGIAPAAALALGAFSQSLVPWGALGIGTKISAAIAGVPVDDLTWRIALVIAPILLTVLPVYWRIAGSAGVAIGRAQRIEDTACFLLLALLLIATNTILPIELAGLAAIAPILLYRLWRSEGAALFSATSLRRGIPYAILMALLAVTKLIPDVTAALSSPAYTPGQGAPAFAPLASPAIPLVFAAILGCFAHGHWHGLAVGIGPTFAKGARACAMTVLLVALAWVIVRSGIAEAFAQAALDRLGRSAALLVPMLGALGGYLTGSNTGAGSLAMPVALSVAGTTDSLRWIAAAAIIAGSVFTAFSPVRFAMGQAIAGADRNDTAKALRALAPFSLATITICVAAVWIMAAR